jgi:TolB-like protein
MSDPIEHRTQQSDCRPLEPDVPQKQRTRKNKVRAAWISFVGRIVAQFIGAAATIALTVVVLQQHQGASGSSGEDRSRTHERIDSPARRSPSEMTHGTTALAVLPVKDFSGTQQDQFADAMTETLVAALARTDGLRVVSRTSAMYYKTARMTVPQIAHDLAVDVIVESSVIRSDGRVRITAQLIDGRSDEHLWTSVYDRPMRDVLTAQADVAATIAQAIKAVLIRPRASSSRAAAVP